MTTYVYDHPSGSTARLGRSLLFGSTGDYWYPNPPTGTPAFSVSGKFVHEHPASSTPRYYLS